MTNYSAGHETRAGLIGPDRFDYPPNHVEAGNRLSWLLGRLDRHYGDRAAYVHLERDPVAVAESFLRRYHEGIIGAYNSQILMGLRMGADPLAVCLDYVDTVTTNIRAFLRDKRRAWTIAIESPQAEFRAFWRGVSAEGDLEAALAEFSVRYNASLEASA